MNLIDIKTAIAEKIQSIGGIVTASEVTEGFDKPTYFVDIFPSDIELQNAYYEIVTLNVEIRYVPLLETSEECIKISQDLKALFTAPIKVDDRFLNAGGISFEMDAITMVCGFPISYMQNTDTAFSDYENMQNIKMKEDLIGYGITTNSN